MSRLQAPILFILLSLCFNLSAFAARPLSSIIDSVVVLDATCGLDNGVIIIYASDTADVRYSIDNGDSYQDEPRFDDLPTDDYLVVILQGTSCSDVNSAQVLNNPDPQKPIMTCPDPLTMECSEVDPLGAVESWLKETISIDFKRDSLPAFSATDLNTLDFGLCGMILELDIVTQDDCLSESSCQGIIDIIDTENPVVTCPNELDIDIADSGYPDQVEEWLEEVDGTDNCASFDFFNDLNETRLNFECDSFYMISVLFTMTDRCGNLDTCRTEINVLNELEPKIVCTDYDFPVSCDTDQEEALDDLIIQFEGFYAFDEDVTIDTSNINELDGLQCGDTLTLRYRVVDGCFRTSNCQAQITIFDTGEPDLIRCPDPLSFQTINEQTIPDIQSWLDDGMEAEDNCTMVDYDNDFDIRIYDDLCNVPDTVIVTFNATDRCGNGTGCESFLFIAPQSLELLCPDTLIVSCGSSANDELQENWLEQASATDQAGNSMAFQSELISDQANPCDSLVTFKLFALDNCEVEKSCLAHIKTIDDTSPSLNCPDPLEVEATESDIDDQLAFWLGMITVSDLCSEASFDYDFILDLAPNTCTFDTLISVIATDECSNESNCSISFSITSNNSLSLSCPSDTIVACGNSDLTGAINGILGEVEVVTSGSYDLTDDFDQSQIDTDCAVSQTLTINSTAIDFCDEVKTCATIIQVLPDGKLYIPSTFSHSSVGEDNSFSVFGNEGIQIISEAKVYDRWGNIINVESGILGETSLEIWDGRINGQSALPGIYIYQLSYTDIFGVTVEKTGQLTLLK